MELFCVVDGWIPLYRELIDRLRLAALTWKDLWDEMVMWIALRVLGEGF